VLEKSEKKKRGKEKERAAVVAVEGSKMGHRVEVNFLRLLGSCERLVTDDKTKRNPDTRKKLQKVLLHALN
jgi:hypothetical protein